MNEQINLLKKNDTAKKEKSKFLTYSFILLLLVIIIAVILLIVTFFLKNQHRSIISSQNEKIAEINLYSENKIMLQSISERLKSITGILSTQNKLVARFISLLSYIPQSLDIEFLSAKENQIKASITTGNLLALNEFLEVGLEELAKKSNEIRRIQIDSSGLRSGVGFYTANITIEYK